MCVCVCVCVCVWCVMCGSVCACVCVDCSCLACRLEKTEVFQIINTVGAHYCAVECFKKGQNS